MPFTIESDDRERFIIRLSNEPSFIHGLAMAPATRETMLDQGKWLVLSFAVWSIADQRQVALAIEFARLLGGLLQLGLRPFESAQEFSSWCDVKMDRSVLADVTAETTSDGGLQIRITGDKGNTPVWLCLRDGLPVGEHHGSLDMEQLRSFTNHCFSMN